MLEQDLLKQVKDIFSRLKERYTLALHGNTDHEKWKEFEEFLTDFSTTSDHIDTITFSATTQPEIHILRNGEETGITFRGIPSGHEFTSLLLALINADGQGKNLPDESTIRRIKALQSPGLITTYVSLSCTNCPDIVQSLNLIALYHPNICHEMVDGALFPDEVESLHLQGVPAVFAQGHLIHSGRGSLSDLLDKLEENFGVNGESSLPETRHYDVIVAGGGPAGSAAAIYSARKGLRVAIIGERIGGQVRDTVGIENLISIPRTTGAELSAGLADHLRQYPIDIFEHRKIEHADLTDLQKTVHTKGGESFTAPAIILATGAGWRQLGVEGESDYLGRGVHFCPHCDGPFYKGKRIAVIGGGNSGIEAAIDLAGLCSHVTVLEFADHLLADEVLQNKAQNSDNIEILTSAATTAIVGDGTKVTGLRFKNRETGEEKEIALDGIFVQIGLAPNTELFATQLPLSPRKEIVIDRACRTSLKGVYAAGDCTDVPYKQIVIAIGEGAKAALSAFDDRLRGIIQT